MNQSRSPRSARLRPFVRSLEYVADPQSHGWERMVPAGGSSLVVTLADDGFDYLTDGVRRAPGAVLAQARDHSQVVSTRPQRGMVAVDFRLGGSAAFLGLPVSAVDVPFAPLAELWGDSGSALRERLLEQPTATRVLDALEAALLERLDPARPDDPAIRRAAAALRAGARVADVAADYGTTAKPFLRRFTERVGLRPKTFARLQRMQRLLAEVGPTPVRDRDWAALAARHGFCDQSHLVHEFTAIVGVRPGAYRARSADAHNHLPAEVHFSPRRAAPGRSG